MGLDEDFVSAFDLLLEAEVWKLELTLSDSERTEYEKLWRAEVARRR